MAGQSNGHGWHRVFYYGDQLDVTQVEVTLLTEPVEHHSVLLYCVAVVVRTHLQMVLRIQTFDRLNTQWILINLELRSAENISILNMRFLFIIAVGYWNHNSG